MNQLKSVYNIPFKDSCSHQIHTHLAMIYNNETELRRGMWFSEKKWRQEYIIVGCISAASLTASCSRGRGHVPLVHGDAYSLGACYCSGGCASGLGMPLVLGCAAGPHPSPSHIPFTSPCLSACWNTSWHNDGLTGVKTLPFPKLRLRVIKMKGFRPHLLVCRTLSGKSWIRHWSYIQYGSFADPGWLSHWSRMTHSLIQDHSFTDHLLLCTSLCRFHSDVSTVGDISHPDWLGTGSFTVMVWATPKQPQRKKST